jgi:DNA-binding NarL/FixJ family response regulator
MSNIQLKILLVDDDPVQAGLIRSLLTAAWQQYELLCAGTLEDGLQMLALREVDVTLLDLGLPDSFGGATYYKFHKQYPDIPVVVLTGVEDELLGIQLVQAGAQDYLVKKQVTSPLLCRALRYAIERKRAALELQRTVVELQKALAEVKTLSGLLPICTHCKKIRDDKGYWRQVEAFIQERSQARFTHGFCPDCIKKYYPECLK